MSPRVSLRSGGDADRPLTAKEVLILARRRRVATLLGRCYTTGEIAELLGVSSDTAARDIKAVQVEFAREMRDSSGVLDVWHRFQRQHLARIRELWALVDRAKGVTEERDGKQVQVIEPAPQLGLKALRELRACADDEIKTAQSLGIVYKAPERRSIDLHLMDQLSTVPEADLDRLLAVPLDELPALLEAMVGPELAARVLGSPAPFAALAAVADAEEVSVEDVVVDVPGEVHVDVPADGAARSPDGLDGQPSDAQVVSAKDVPSSYPRLGGAPAMSWSTHYNGLEQFRKDEPAYPAQNFDPALEVEFTEQLKAARGVVEALVASGAIGGAGKDYRISLSGHANPGHEPRAGYANDCVTVSITQAAPAVVANAPSAGDSAAFQARIDAIPDSGATIADASSTQP